MDYRSIIALSYENKQNALKEVKKNSSVLPSSSKQKGPSNDAVKRFLEKKRNEEVEWFKKIKVDKPPPPPKKQKKKSVQSTESTLDVKASSAQSAATSNKKSSGENVEKSLKKTPQLTSSVEPLVRSTGNVETNRDTKPKKIKSKGDQLDKGSKISSDSIKPKKDKKEPKISSASTREIESKPKKIENKSSVVPSFTNYSKILEMANRNAEKPPKYVADPDTANLEERRVKRKAEKSDPLFEAQLEVSAPKKRKLAENKKSQKYDSETTMKKKTVEQKPCDIPKPSIANKNVDKVYTKSPKSAVTVTQKPQRLTSSVKSAIVDKKSSEAPSVPARRGIAAQLSNNAFSSEIGIRSNSMSPSGVSKSSKHSHVHEVSGKTTSSSTNNSNQNVKQLSQSSKPKSSSTSHKSETNSKKVITADTTKSNSAPTKVKNSCKISEKKKPVSNGMSVTMEDGETDFMHFNSKRDSKAPPLAAPQPPRRGIAAQSAMVPPRRGIAAQSGMPPGPPVRRGIAAQNAAFENSRSKPRPYRPCVDSDEEEDDYDEDDDFIDDSEMVTDKEYKSYVKEIHQSLRFDPTKYESVKPWDDLRSMESNYKEIEKEEKRSYRLGLKEDMDDIKAEEERLKKKKKKKR